MKMLFTLAWRNLWRKKRRTLITVSSVMFAAILSIVLMSMVSGMKDQMVASIVRNTTGYLQIQDVLFEDEPSMDHAMEYTEEVRSAIENHRGRISYTVPRIEGFCLASRDMGTRGAYVMGVVAEKENRMNNLSNNLTEGRMFEPGERFAVVAKGLAQQLELSLGDTIVLLGQGFQGMTAAGTFEVGGIIEFLMPEQNNTMVYLPLEEAQYFFAAPDRLTGLIIMVDDDPVVPDLAQSLQAELDEEWYAMKTWQDLLPGHVAAFEARDAQIRIFAWVLYIVVGFGIFGTVVTMIYERLREFGITLSIGLKRFQLAFVCMLETILIGFLGVVAGILVGFGIVFRLHHSPIQLRGDLAEVMIDMAIEPVMTFSIDPGIFLYQGLTIFLIAIVVGLYPVTKVYRMDMVSAARN